MRALGLSLALFLAAACGESGSDGDGADGSADVGATGGSGGDAAPNGGTGGGLILDGGGGNCPAPYDPSAPVHLPSCPGLTKAKWGASAGACGAPSDVAVDSECTGQDPGPTLVFSPTDPCTAAEADPSKHVSWQWDFPIGIQADCERTVFSHGSQALEVWYGGSSWVAGWVGASGEPTRVRVQADVSVSGCNKRVWITQGCSFDVLIVELPTTGGVIAFDGQELAKVWPDSVGPACPNGPAALCGRISWPELSPGHAGCIVERTLPTCGALVHDCACGGGALQLVAGRASCAGPVRLGWSMSRNPYWRCL